MIWLEDPPPWLKPCVFLRATTKKRSSTFFEEKNASGWPGWRIFWPRNDLAPQHSRERKQKAEAEMTYHSRTEWAAAQETERLNSLWCDADIVLLASARYAAVSRRLAAGPAMTEEDETYALLYKMLLPVESQTQTCHMQTQELSLLLVLYLE